MRRYLMTHDELPGPSLVAVAPLSIRNADTSAGAPAGLSLMRVPLGTEIEDPVRRLRQVHQYTANAQEIEHAVGAKELTDITKHAPAATLAMSARLLAGSALGLGQRQPLASSRYSWNDSRMQIAKYSGSGICSRHDVGEMMILPS